MLAPPWISEPGWGTILTLDWSGGSDIPWSALTPPECPVHCGRGAAAQHRTVLHGSSGRPEI
ncbi:Hypothetical predicted protein, partial [Pelobates cultripes]